jgi:hypothetical protein
MILFQQNTVENYSDFIPMRQKLKKRLTLLWQNGKKPENAGFQAFPF